MSYNFAYDKVNYTSDSISIKKFSLSVPGKHLFIESPLTISPGNIYGLIGKNGCGKTSLLKQLALNNIFDESKIHVLYVEQELEMNDTNPVDFIFTSNTRVSKPLMELERLEKVLEEAGDDEYDEIMQKCEELRDDTRGHNKEAEYGKIKSILKGLGFSHEGMTQPCTIFSGGWRMRISLARALYLEPDLLLLDEPTNHLDLEAIIWLGDYMRDWKGIAMIVTHNIGFLNECCSHILNIENNKLVTYKGNYAMFKSSLAQKQKELEKTYDSYEKKLKEFKKKNPAKNALDEFIKKNEIPRPEKPYEVNVEFISASQFKSHIIKMEDVSFGYEENKPILENINLGFDMNTRATLVGVNGSGKSTLMKLMTGEIKPLSGTVWKQNNLRVGYYNQHFEEQLPMDVTPIEHLVNQVPENLIVGTRESTVRSYLGKVKLEGSAHTKIISELSGGQKARVAIVKLIFQQPHIMLLDEPTNHLDIETVSALIDGLKDYDGGILLITHEPELINALESELWIMNKEKKSIEIYNKTYEDYCEMIISATL